MKRFLIALVVGLLIVGGLVWLRTSQRAHRSKEPDPDSLPIPVAVAAAVRQDVPLTVDGIGTVQALNTVNIRPLVDGPIVEIRFREGQDVKTGDVLARIDPRTYQATYDQAVAKKAQDEASLENAVRDLGRYDKLAKTQYTTAQQADTQRAMVAQDQALTRQDQAQIDSAKTNLGYTTILAPVDGRIGIRQVDLGNIVHSTDTTPITVITTLKPINVVFTLPQQTLPLVASAMAAAHNAGGPEVLALPQSGETGLDGKPAEVLDRGHVAVLDNQVDQNTGTIKLKAVFANPALRLWPGAFVNIRLSLSTDRDVVTIPIAAVQRGPQGAFVFIAQPDGTVARHAITVARQTEALAVVPTGLKAGQDVVTDGASRLSDGSKYRKLEEPAKTN